MKKGVITLNEDLLREIVERLVAIETRLEDIVKIKDTVEHLKTNIVELKEKDKQQERDINELRDTNRWLVRAVIGGIITVALGVIGTLIKLAVGG